MSGLIQTAKEKIWSIASTMAQVDPMPELKIGLVAYRDRGDAYVTRVADLSSDLDILYGKLMDFEAQGGGDTPESVNQALHEAVQGISWSQDDDTYRVIFLVGDAPPHMDYQDDIQYPQTLVLARQRGIVINTIQCGNHGLTTAPWTQIASLGNGRYFDVEQAGGSVALATPFDDGLADLSARLDDTRLYYGNEEDKVTQTAKLAATRKLEAGASLASKARRAVFNAAPAGADSFLGKGELVDDVRSGRVDLDTIDEEKLPEPVWAMEREARLQLVQEQSERRAQLKSEIQELARKRDDYLKEKIAEAGGAEESLDHKLYQAVKDQARTAGIHYEAEAPAY